MQQQRYHLSELPTLVGKEIGVSDWFLIDQDRISRFAEVTEDRQWIHVDEARAKAAMGGTIAHGFLTLSLLSHLAAGILHFDGVRSGLNYGCDRVRFTCPVASGSRVRLRMTLSEANEVSGGWALKYHCVMEIEGNEKPALVADWLARLYA